MSVLKETLDVSIVKMFMEGSSAPVQMDMNWAMMKKRVLVSSFQKRI